MMAYALRAALALALVAVCQGDDGEHAFDDDPHPTVNSFEAPPAGFHKDPAGSTVSAGHFHTCALRASDGDFGGIAHCWGFDAMGQVSRSPSTPMVQLSSGHFHSCGLTLGEKIFCWGQEKETAHSPEGLFSQVSAGQFHSCGLTKDGDARCWGEDYRALGAVFPPPGKFVQIGAGYDFTCGLRPSGFVECWGGDDKGQASPPSDVRFEQLECSTSSAQACGLTLGDRDLVCWGHDNKGAAPRFVAGPFVQVATGYKTTCAIRDPGSAIDCWGVSSHVFETAEKPKFAGRTFEQISVGMDHVCALDVDGEVLCEGQPLAAGRDVPPGFVAA